jgi:hypothetical protein
VGHHRENPAVDDQSDARLVLERHLCKDLERRQ